MTKPTFINLETEYTPISESLRSNPGRFFRKNSNAKEYYIKWLPDLPVDHLNDNKSKYKNRNWNRINNEFLALKIYELFCVRVPKAEFISFTDNNGIKNFGIATEKQNNITALCDAPKNGIITFETVCKKAQEDFLVDVLLSNYDVVGLYMDNLHYDNETGETFRIDSGGALKYRARGAAKKRQFDDQAHEFEEMVSGHNHKTGFCPDILSQTSKVFKGVHNSPELLVGFKKLFSVNNQQLIDCVNEYGFDIDTPKGKSKNEALIAKLLTRKMILIAKTETILLNELLMDVITLHSSILNANVNGYTIKSSCMELLTHIEQWAKQQLNVLANNDGDREPFQISIVEVWRQLIDLTKSIIHVDDRIENLQKYFQKKIDTLDIHNALKTTSDPLKPKHNAKIASRLTNFSLFQQIGNEYLQDHRHVDANIQREYDKRFGLALI